MKSRLLLAPIAMIAALASAYAQEVPVGVLSAQSGSTAFSGVPMANGIHLAVDEANQKNYLGTAKVKLIDGDYASDKAQAISLANQFAKRDKVVLAFGPLNTPDTLAVAPVFNENKTPIIALATSDRVLETGPYTFKLEVTPAELLVAVAKYVVEKTPIRKVAVVYQTTNDAQLEMKDVFVQNLKAGGGTVVSDDGLSPNESNFLPLVTKIVSEDVEGVFIILNAEQAANLMVQLRQGGLPASVPFIGSTSVVSPRMLAIAGRAAEGTIAQAEFISGQERNKEFETAYKARFGIEADAYAGLGYTIGLIGLQAIKGAGPNPTPEKVREALMSVGQVAVPAGGGTWSHVNRRPVYESVIVQVKGGKFVPVP
jgi:branched-chain amino acid transport system substrate-binding protein